MLSAAELSRVAAEFAALARALDGLCTRPLAAEPEPQLRALASCLARTIAAALELPEVEPTGRDDVEPTPGPLALGFGRHDRYLECFDPYDLDATPVLGSLADDLADVRQDLARGLATLARGTPDDVRDAVWTWRFHFAAHWGEHATGALRALYWLLSRG